MPIHPTEKALRHIANFVTKRGYFPSCTELAESLGVHRSMASRRINALVRMKLVETNDAGRIISIQTEYPASTKWLASTKPLSPSPHGRSGSRSSR